MTMKGSMLSSLPLGRTAVAVVAAQIAMFMLLVATGNNHAGLHHPSWVNVSSGLFFVCQAALVAIAVVALKRHRR